MPNNTHHDFSHSSHEDLRTAEFSQMKSLPNLVSRYLWKKMSGGNHAYNNFSIMLFRPSVTRTLFCLTVTADLLNRSAESMKSWFFWSVYSLCLTISNEIKFSLLFLKKHAFQYFHCKNYWITITRSPFEWSSLLNTSLSYSSLDIFLILS